MDSNFQTSFIPKKPLVADAAPRTHRVSIFNFLATLVFFASLAAGGGMYFYKHSLETKIENQQADLRRAEAAFEPEAIDRLATLDRRLSASEEILDTHLSVTPLLDLIESATVISVQFTDFSYELPEKPGDAIKVSLTGVGPGYKTVGLQEEAFAGNKYIKNPIFSDLALGTRGQITFHVDFDVDPALLSYEPGSSGAAPVTFTEPTTFPVTDMTPPSTTTSSGASSPSGTP